MVRSHQPGAPKGRGRAPGKARYRRGVSPLAARVCSPVVENNCVAARRGGEQLETNNQSVTKVNPIRRHVVTSLRPNGEVLHTGLLALNEHLTNRNQRPHGHTEDVGPHGVVGDGMVGRYRELTWESWPDRPGVHAAKRRRRARRSAVRAAIVAVKRGNSRGAKGGRKMDVP